MIGQHFAPSPFLHDRIVAIRFSVPVRSRELLIEASAYVLPRHVRLRGPGVLRQAYVDEDRPILAGPVKFELFADRGGSPASPRCLLRSDEDALDDSSDGPPVDWPAFGPDKPLRLELECYRAHAFSSPELASKDAALHVILTGPTHPPMGMNPCYPGIGPSPIPLPTARFRYVHEDAWKTATVVDYASRAGAFSGPAPGTRADEG